MNNVNKPAWAGRLLDSLYWSIRDGKKVDNIPGLLKQLIEDDLWREVYVEEYDEICRYDTFEQFLTTPTPKGAGTSVETVKRLIGDDAQALNMLDVAIQRSVGKPEGGKGGNQYTLINNNVINKQKSPVGNTRQSGIRRLRKSRPDLLARVTSGELSTHKAMIEAGFRKRTISICPDDIPSVIEKLRREFAPDQLEEIIRGIQ